MTLAELGELLGLEAQELPVAPLQVHRGKVLADWIDYNGHMNVAYYFMVFDHAMDSLLDMLDLGIAHVERDKGSMFVLETHVAYLQEVEEGAPLALSCQLVDADQKRLHLYFEMHHGDQGFLAATSEIMALHVDMASRKSAPFPAAAQTRIDRLMAQHGALERPERVGASIGIRRKP